MLCDALKRQFDNSFDILAAAIPTFAPDAWRKGSPPFNGPARAALHVLQCAEFYTNEDGAVFIWLGKKCWELADGELPSQQQMLDYLAEDRAKTLAWIDGIGDAGLAAAWHDTKKAATALERIVYALRHLQHHIGEICAYQKQNGLEPAPWK
jgi:hypothetical protein